MLRRVLLLTSIFASGCGLGIDNTKGTTVTTSTGGGEPTSFAAASASLTNGFGAGGTSVNALAGGAPSGVIGAATVQNGAVYAAVQRSGQLGIEKTSNGTLSSVFRIDFARSLSLAEIGSSSTLLTTLAYVSSLSPDQEGRNLYLLDLVAQKVPAGTNNGVLIRLDTNNSDAVTILDLSSSADLPLGLAVSGSKLFYTAKTSSGAGAVFQQGVSAPLNTSFAEPTGIAADESFVYVYDIVDSLARIYRMNQDGSSKTEMTTAEASTSTIPLALAAQTNFKALFFIDGTGVKTFSLPWSAGSSANQVVSKTLLKEISGITYSSAKSALFVSSEIENKILYALANKS